MQRYNVEHRAEKMVNKFEDPAAKPHRAPMYKSDAEVLEAVRRDNPDVLHSVAAKDDPLHDRLKSVYVSSADPEPQPRADDSSNRPLPRDVKQHYQDFIPAQLRVEREGIARTLPRGKVSLNQAVTFITKHSESQGAFGTEQISEEYRLNKEVVDNTLKYFNIFSMMVPETREKESDRPDPLQAGPDWQIATDQNVSSLPRQLETEYATKISSIKDKHFKRLEAEEKYKKIQPGGD